MSIAARRQSRSTTVVAAPAGDNLLVGKLFTADVVDSIAEPGHPITHVTDQNDSTRWISQPQSPVNMTVDLGGVYDMNRVVIVFAADTIRNYTVSVSTNGSSYTQISSGTTNNTESQTITITSFSNTPKGRYLRITGHDRWNASYGNSIWEVEAYGTLDSSYPVGSITNFTTTVASDTQLNLAWAYSGSALSGYTLRRDGTVIASPAAGATSYNNTGLTAGTTYNYTLTGAYTAGGNTNTAAASGMTSGGAPGGTGWISGVSNVGYIKDQGAAFSAWRGELCTGYRFWLSGPNQDNAGWWMTEQIANWNGILDYAIGAPPAAGVSWQSAASGGYDAQWRAQMQGIHANWGQLTGVYLAPAHELNGDWYSWSITPANVSYFRTAWQRFYGIVQDELVSKGRHAKVTLNYAAGRGMVEEIWPGNNYVDIVGFDIYDHWLPTANGMNCLTESDWNNLKYAVTGDGSPRGPYSIQQWAQSKGKPFAMPEWGLSDSTDPVNDPIIDNAFWIQKMHGFFAEFAPANKLNAGAGKLAFENIFSAAGLPYRLSVWPQTSQNPNASNMYQSLSWGQ